MMLNRQKNLPSDILDPLLSYHFRENHLPSSTTVLGTHASLLTFSILAAGILYEKLAIDFAHSETEEYFNVAGTCYSACIVLVVTTINAYNRHIAPQFIPENLNAILVPPLSAFEWYRDSAIILLTSAICSVPFVTIAWDIGIASGFWGWALLGVIFIANMLLHCDPVKLNLSHPLYGFIPNFLKNIFLFLICYRQTPEEKAAQEEKMKVANNIGQVERVLRNAWEHYLDKKITQRAKGQIVDLDDFPFDANSFLKTILSEYREVPQLNPTLILSARIFGIVIELVGCIGYLANPYIVLPTTFLTNKPLAYTLATLSSYMLGTLLAFFGELTAMLTLQLLLIHGPNVVEESAFTRLHPKVMYSLMMLNLLLLVFSAAAAKYTIRLAFPDMPWAGKATLYTCAQIATSIVGFVVPTEYEKDLGSSISRLYDRDSFNRVLMTQNAQFNGFVLDLYRIKDINKSEALLETVNRYCHKTPEGNSNHLAYKPLQKWFSWCYVNKSDIKQPLLKQELSAGLPY